MKRGPIESKIIVCVIEFDIFPLRATGLDWKGLHL